MARGETMKKILLIACLLLGTFAFAEENEFTWSKYEMACYSRGEVPSYEKYERLLENPQCYGDSIEECLKLFEE